MSRWLDRAIEALCAFSLVAMTLVVSLQVLVRNTAQWHWFKPEHFYWTDELSGFLLVWAGLLGAALCVRERAHVGMDIWVNRMSEAGKARAARLATACVVIFSLVVMVGGGLLLVYSQLQSGQLSAALGVRMAWVYTAVPLAGLLNVFYALRRRHA